MFSLWFFCPTLFFGSFWWSSTVDEAHDFLFPIFPVLFGIWFEHSWFRFAKLQFAFASSHFSSECCHRHSALLHSQCLPYGFHPWMLSNRAINMSNFVLWTLKELNIATRMIHWFNYLRKHLTQIQTDFGTNLNWKRKDSSLILRSIDMVTWFARKWICR